MSANLENSAVATGLEKSVFIPIPKKAMPKNVQTTSQLHSFHMLAGEGNGNPLQYSCLQNPVDRGAWWAAVYGVTQSRKQLK